MMPEDRDSHPEDWRWAPDRRYQPSPRSIYVIERPSDEQDAARDRDDKAIAAGAQRRAFGFAQALEPVEAPWPEDAAWEGQGL